MKGRRFLKSRADGLDLFYQPDFSLHVNRKRREKQGMITALKKSW